MFSLRQILLVHAELIEKYGGLQGVRDRDSLESALNRPFQFFADVELYPSPHHKAAAILQSIIINHPFVDGNKRTAFYLASVLLLDSNLEFTATEDEKYDFLIDIAKGEMEFDSIVEWLIEHTKS